MLSQISRTCCRLSRSKAGKRSISMLKKPGRSPGWLPPARRIRRFSMAATGTGNTSPGGGSMIAKLVALGVCFTGGIFFQKSMLSQPISSDKNYEYKPKPIDPKYLSNWELYYWTMLGGRGMYVRMLLLLANATWNEPARENFDEDGKPNWRLTFNQKSANNPLYPCWAPPILIHNKTFLLSQTPAIVLYLSNLFNLRPKNEQDYAHGMQIMLQVLDLLTEAESAYHPVHRHKSYKLQMTEAEPHIQFYLKERLPKQLRVVQEALKRSPGNGNGWFYGCEEPTFVDACVATFMRGYATSQKEHYDNNKEFELLKKHRERFESIERIGSYLNDPKRRPPIDDNSFMG